MKELIPVESLDAQAQQLAKLAIEAQQHAYAPYSKFKVGSALVDCNGEIHTGCNVENASYGLTICSERTALVKMVSSTNALEAKRIVLITSSDDVIWPCGACRQVIHELGPECEVISLTGDGKFCIKTTIDELLPGAFKKDDVEELNTP